MTSSIIIKQTMNDLTPNGETTNSNTVHIKKNSDSFLLKSKYFDYFLKVLLIILAASTTTATSALV
jgi:hypothetical protein